MLLACGIGDRLRRVARVGRVGVAQLVHRVREPLDGVGVLRRRGRGRGGVLSGDLRELVEPDAGLLALSDKETVRQALTRLTPLQQEIIVLRFVEGYSTEEIASLVGRREGTVRGIQFRALEALRSLIPSREALA